MDKVIEVWADSGEIVEREMNAEEIAQRVKDQEAEALRISEAHAKAEQRTALLNRLGITEDEAKLLLS